MVQKVLMIFCFETGDASATYWDEAAVVYVDASELILNVCNELEDSMSSYLEAHLGDEIPYDKIVADVLNASGRAWRDVCSHKSVVADTYRIIYV